MSTRLTAERRIRSASGQVAAEVRAEMARQQRIQSELAVLLDLSQTAISRRLKGEVPFDVDELVQVARFLDVPIHQLLAAVA